MAFLLYSLPWIHNTPGLVPKSLFWESYSHVASQIKGSDLNWLALQELNPLRHLSYSRQSFTLLPSRDMNNIRQVQALNKRELENAVYVYDLLIPATVTNSSDF
jgi:hypothetical protein